MYRLRWLLAVLIVAGSIGIGVTTANASHGGCTVTAGRIYTYGGQGTQHLFADGWQYCDTYLTQTVNLVLQRHQFFVFWTDVGSTNLGYIVAQNLYQDIDRGCEGSNLGTFRARVIGQHYSPITGYYESATVYTTEAQLYCAP